jgi:DNA helicase TIP49 (TBP-interacting protein)
MPKPALELLRCIHSLDSEETCCCCSTHTAPSLTDIGPGFSSTPLASGLAKQSGSDVAHVSLLESVIHTVILVDTEEKEGLYNPIDIKTHVNESVYEGPVVAAVSAIKSVQPVLKGQLINPFP